MRGTPSGRDLTIGFVQDYPDCLPQASYVVILVIGAELIGGRYCLDGESS